MLTEMPYRITVLVGRRNLMLLVIDVGNTNTVIGVYDGQKCLGVWRIRTVANATADEYRMTLNNLTSMEGLGSLTIDGVIISCVVPTIVTALEELCRSFLKLEPLFVGPGIKTGMPIRYDNPREVGADRIVNAVAAFEKYRCELIAVDFGTATTFDYINAAGEYEGGIIAPGVRISAEALFQRASKLFRVELAAPEKVLGKDTASAIQSGIVYGYASLVDGILERMFEQLHSRPKVIATGGLARIIAAETKLLTEIDDNLTLEGLRILYDRNRPTTKT
jgi:type III pantothenate kinase